MLGMLHFLFEKARRAMLELVFGNYLKPYAVCKLPRNYFY